MGVRVEKKKEKKWEDDLKVGGIRNIKRGNKLTKVHQYYCLM